MEQIGEYQTLLSDLEEAQLMLDDPDMKDLAAEELPTIKARIPEVEHALQLALLPKDAADARPAMLEIRPEQVGKRPHCSQVIYCACINVIAKPAVGRSM